jgi:lipoprotein NlpD
MIRRVLTSIVLLSLVTGCSHRLSNWDPDDYTVKSGDTLYSIAWRYEIDPTEMARWNSLSSPYVIRPGDRLHTKASDSNNPTASSSPVRQKNKSLVYVEKGDTLYSLAKENDMPAWKLASINGLKKPYVIYPGQGLRLKASSTRTATTTSKPKTKKTWSPADSRRAVSWQWPVKGRVLSKFNKRKNDAKGINIAGKEGYAVKAAAPGKVVYSGNGLISYGNLIIIKHSRSYLSAYAHNRKLLVKEGQMVKVGQKIAELGKTGTEKPQLHFEIRKNGKPVNPLLYLPSS